MFLLKTSSHFSAAHSIKGYEGKCKNVHGHNWIVEVVIKTKEKDELGMSYDFSDLKHQLEEVLDILDHSNLNELQYFEDKNPTAENISKFIYNKLSQKVPSFTEVRKITLEETPNNSLSYIPDEDL